MSSKFSDSLRVPVSDSSLSQSLWENFLPLSFSSASLGKCPTSPSLQCLKATHNFQYAQLRYLINPKISLIHSNYFALFWTWYVGRVGWALGNHECATSIRRTGKSSWPRARLPAWRWRGDHGSEFSQWTRTSSDPGLGANWEGEKSGTERAVLQRGHTSHPSQPVRTTQLKSLGDLPCPQDLFWHVCKKANIKILFATLFITAKNLEKKIKA